MFVCSSPAPTPSTKTGKRQRRVRMMSTVDAATDADTAGGGSTDKAEAPAAGGRSAGDGAGDSEDSTADVDDMSDEAQPDYYGALGVPEEASPTDIKVCGRGRDECFREPVVLCFGLMELGPEATSCCTAESDPPLNAHHFVGSMKHARVFCCLLCPSPSLPPLPVLASLVPRALVFYACWVFFHPLDKSFPPALAPVSVF